MRDFTRFLKMNDVKYVENQPLARYSSIRIGGNCETVVFPMNNDQLVDVVRFLEKAKKRYKILGRMSNVLPPDEKCDFVVVKTDNIRSMTQSGNIIKVASGESLPALSSRMIDIQLSGLEQLSGIPGSVGGAIVGNAGAFGREISDLVKRIEFYDPSSDSIETIDGDEADFAYRYSYFKNKSFIILSAILNLRESRTDLIRAEIERCRRIRKETQPTGEPSLGSAFKRPKGGEHAAKMIDECGLRGYRIGGAQISPKHAGFIVNIGSATQTDYLGLLKYAEDRVYERFGVKLEREIEIL